MFQQARSFLHDIFRLLVHLNITPILLSVVCSSFKAEPPTFAPFFSRWYYLRPTLQRPGQAGDFRVIPPRFKHPLCHLSTSGVGFSSVAIVSKFLHEKFISLTYHITNFTSAIVLRQVIWKLRVLNSNPADIVVSFWCVHFDVMTLVAHLNADETQRAHLWHLATLTSTKETESIETYWQIYIKIQF